MAMRNYMVRLPEEVDDQLRALRKAGFLPAVLIRDAIADMAAKKMREVEAKKNE
jgi:hypothetical protein